MRAIAYASLATLALVPLAAFASAETPATASAPAAPARDQCQITVWTGGSPQVDTQPLLGILYLDWECASRGLPGTWCSVLDNSNPHSLPGVRAECIDPPGRGWAA